MKCFERFGKVKPQKELKDSVSKIIKCGFSNESTTLAKTSLYNWHLQHGGKMVPFAGYELPVQYEGMGVLKEHLRKLAILCTMGEIYEIISLSIF